MVESGKLVIKIKIIMNYHSNLFPFTSRWLQIEGIQLHYIDEGSGTIILFSHAALSSSFMYRRFFAILSKKYRCIALDFPGFGLSDDHPDSIYTYVEQGRFLEKFILKLNLKDILLLGHDTGGPSAFWAACRLSERINGFILTDTLPFPTDEYPRIHRMLRVIDSNLFRWLNRHTNLLVKVTVNLGVMTRKLTRAEKEGYEMLFRMKNRRDRIVDVLTSLRKFPEELERIKAAFEGLFSAKPCLMIYGDKDPVYQLGIPARVKQLNPGAQLFTIRGEGHFPHEGQAETMCEIIDQWMGQKEAFRVGSLNKKYQNAEVKA